MLSLRLETDSSVQAMTLSRTTNRLKKSWSFSKLSHRSSHRIPLAKWSWDAAADVDESCIAPTPLLIATNARPCDYTSMIDDETRNWDHANQVLLCVFTINASKSCERTTTAVYPTKHIDINWESQYIIQTSDWTPKKLTCNSAAASPHRLSSSKHLALH